MREPIGKRGNEEKNRDYGERIHKRVHLKRGGEVSTEDQKDRAR